MLTNRVFTNSCRQNHPTFHFWTFIFVHFQNPKHFTNIEIHRKRKICWFLPLFGIVKSNKTLYPLFSLSSFTFLEMKRREKTTKISKTKNRHRLVMNSVFSETILTILEISKSGGSCPHMSSWSSVMYSSCFLVVISECVGLFCFHVFIPKNPFLDMRYIILRTVIFGISVGK